MFKRSASKLPALHFPLYGSGQGSPAQERQDELPAARSVILAKKPASQPASAGTRRAAGWDFPLQGVRSRNSGADALRGVSLPSLQHLPRVLHQPEGN